MGDEQLYVEKYSERTPPFHLTAEDVTMELDQHRVLPTFSPKHMISRGLGGKHAVQYFTSWDGVEVKTWEHETDLEQYGNLVSRSWAGEPLQVGGENAKYGRFKAQLAKRTSGCARGDRHVATEYKFVAILGEDREFTTRHYWIVHIFQDDP